MILHETNVKMYGKCFRTFDHVDWKYTSFSSKKKHFLSPYHVKSLESQSSSLEYFAQPNWNIIIFMLEN